eukprot:scaffold4718_cov138-Skeletonema_marinoi.AAC.7
MCNDDGLPVQYFFFAWVTSTLLDLEKALAAVVALVAPVSNKGENSLRKEISISMCDTVKTEISRRANGIAITLDCYSITQFHDKNEETLRIGEKKLVLTHSREEQTWRRRRNLSSVMTPQLIYTD